MQSQILTESGNITIKQGIVFLRGEETIEAVLPEVIPGAICDEGDDGKVLYIIASGFNEPVHFVGPVECLEAPNTIKFVPGGFTAGTTLIAFEGGWHAAAAPNSMYNDQVPVVQGTVWND